MNENERTAHQNLYTAKSVLRRKCTAVNADIIRKQLQINHVHSHFKNKEMNKINPKQTKGRK